MSQHWNDAQRQKHVRAICKEIGERLSFMLDRTAREPPRRLVALLGRFEEMEMELTQSPSIVPTLEEIQANRAFRR